MARRTHSSVVTSVMGDLKKFYLDSNDMIGKRPGTRAQPGNGKERPPPEAWVRAHDRDRGPRHRRQPIAPARGGSVGPAPRPEIGWSRIDSDDRALIPEGPWFQ